jgi:hypothetical protein
MSGFQANKNDVAIGNGGAGTPEVWDIISPAAHDFTGKIVTAFMCLAEDGDTMDEMEEETTISKGGRPGVSEAVAAKYLTYTYPQYCIFEGRYTKLVPTTGLFKVWFLK